jgi:DNA-binding response OmpR family regulator
MLKELCVCSETLLECHIAPMAAMGAMKHKILFIDDCSTTLLIKQMGYARRSEYHLIMARDGQEAIAKATAEPPNLILMDATPRNIEVCREMRKVQKLQDVPILMVSSSSEPAQRDSGFANGDKDDKTSPFSWTELLDMVNSRLATYGMH